MHIVRRFYSRSGFKNKPRCRSNRNDFNNLSRSFSDLRAPPPWKNYGAVTLPTDPFVM
jgi:hypothetical protein